MVRGKVRSFPVEEPFLILLFFYFFVRIESSPSGSPKKNRRPVSVGSEKQLPAITEITELTSLSDSKLPALKPADSKLSAIENGYKINQDIIKKAEDLLGKVSLDNPDLTVTSLNYIDEQKSPVAIMNR